MLDVEDKSKNIYDARNYVYRKGEAEMIADRKFDKAIKEGTLFQFPNVTYFMKKKEVELE